MTFQIWTLICWTCSKSLALSPVKVVDEVQRVSLCIHTSHKFVGCLRPTGEALTQSSLLEADGENGDGMVTMTTTVEPMNLHHAMLRSPGRCFFFLYEWQGDTVHRVWTKDMSQCCNPHYSVNVRGAESACGVANVLLSVFQSLLVTVLLSCLCLSCLDLERFPCWFSNKEPTSQAAALRPLCTGTVYFAYVTFKTLILNWLIV